MATPDGTTRKLPFSLSSTEDMESIVGSEELAHVDLSTWAESDPDIKIPIVLNLSLNEYIALASTIDVGRDIAYGDHSVFIWWLWIRSLESMTICDAIIACINDPDSGVAQAIINIIGSQNVDNSIVLGQSQSGLIFGAGNNPSCNLDILWGGINNLVDQMNVNNEDALQILEVATNFAEFVGDVVGGLAGIELPLIQSMLDWALFIQDNILENYEAQITTAYMDTIKCDLFCLATDDCELTPQMIVDYFFGRLESQLTFNSFLNESLEFLVFGVWTGTEIADAMMLSQIVFRAQLGHWFQDIAFNSVDLDMRLGFNDPSNDWTLLCECGWSHSWLNGDGTPTVDGWSLIYGTYDAGNDRFIEGFVNSSSNASRVEYLIPAGNTTRITKMTMRYDTQTPSDHVRTQYIRIFDESLILIASATRVVSGSEIFTFSWDGDELVPENYKLMFQAGCSSIEPSHARILIMAVEGTGDDLWL